MVECEIKARIDQLGNAWEEFKRVNDRRLEEVRTHSTREVSLQAEVLQLKITLENARKNYKNYDYKKLYDEQRAVNRENYDFKSRTITEYQAEVERLKVGMAMVEPFLDEITSVGGKYGYHMGAIVYDANSLKRELNQED